MNFTALELSIITCFCFNQSTGESLVKMLRYYEQLPVEIRTKIQFILVDDGSPVQVSIPGFEDSFFVEFLKAKGNSTRYFSRLSKIRELAVDRNKAYYSYSRDTSVNQTLFDAKCAKLKGKNLLSAHSRRFLELQSEKVVKRMKNQES